MKTRIRALHFDADKKLEESITERAENLYNVDHRILNINVVLRIEKNDKNKNKKVEMELQLPDRRLYAEDQSESFEEAANLAVDELRKQLIKYKEKLSETHLD